MVMKDLITEVINDYLKQQTMLKEYKNPKDSETLRVCAEMLENIYNGIISNGGSRNEITTQRLGNVIAELRKIEKAMEM